MAGLDFKSSGVHRKVGAVGSIPMHLRHFCFQQLVLPRPPLKTPAEKPEKRPVVLVLYLFRKFLSRFPSEDPAE